ncbi:PAS domain S-box protein [Pararhizobium sp. BT-229]|uniref:PAS domain S-box protein n=1 Tax=Pararhizobium sp. BT-229 TaxID=2986923 RepID=UPI0021F74863|nr:PAS domain S-box protein [Pararhizobium sp. BT-229]MCV9966114.1 PAS domain S-box protein [Pararhizobium sp. BT-229]
MSSLSLDSRDDDAGGIETPLSDNRLRQSSVADLGVQHILEALPEPIYMTDASGRITFYNSAAAEMWGVRPEIGRSEFCGSWKLYWPDGTPLPHDECPMAATLKERRANRGLEAVAERPDGTRIPFLAFPTPLFDADGNLTGAVNMLVDLTERTIVDETAQRFSAIVESSDDAIIAKDLKGRIISWNRGAERLFGYTAAEIIGRSVTILIPLDRHDEEPDILGRIRRGERIDHYETIRRRKDGTLVEISLSVSPIRSRDGRVIGASKIARDITERRRAEEQQHLLIREMDHRVKNLFALAGSVVSLSARSASTPAELASTVRDRLNALAQAHALTVPSTSEATGRTEQTTTLHRLIETILAPYHDCPDNPQPRATIAGPDISIGGAAVTSFALLLHEFATNAAKYGALSVTEGVLNISCHEEADRFVLTWTERGGPPVERQTDGDGFGTVLGKATVRNQLGGEIVRDWKPEGLSIRLAVALDRLGAQ